MIKGPIHILKEDATVAGLVGENQAGEKAKVYPVFVPQGEKHPYIVVRQTGKVIQVKNGQNGKEFACTIDVYSYEESYDAVEALDLAVVEALTGIQPGTFNAVEIHMINHENTQDQHVDEPKQLYVKVSSFSLYVTEG
jgi:Protein of unknown function (DUF3168)